MIQIIEMRICNTISDHCENVPIFNNFRTQCKQEYVNHQLVALGDDGINLVIDTFKFPSCCTCNVVTKLYL